MTKLRTKPYVQFPVRLNHILNNKFTDISHTTHITKSELIRIAVQKLIEEVTTTGAIKHIGIKTFTPKSINT